MASGKYNFEGVRIPLSTRLNIPFFQFMLYGYEDREITDLLEFGFPIGFVGKLDRLTTTTKNQKGVTEYPTEVRKYLVKEKQYGAILGPLREIPFEQEFCISPLNTVSKRDSDERRVILDLSFPEGNAVNEHIPKDRYLDSFVNLKFPKVDDFVNLIKKKGRNCLLFKRDLKRAYRQIPVDVTDVPLLGYAFENQYYFDLFLSMGLRSAAQICQRVTNAIQYMCHILHIAILNYLDDLAGADEPESAWRSYSELGNILSSCGLEESSEKACPPNTQMTFIGVLFNSQDLTLSVTPERVKEILELVNIWLLKSTATLKELQSLIGKLSFIASCVHSSRIFIARLLNWLRSIPEKQSAQPVPSHITKDLMWWKRFLKVFNGISMMLLEDWSSPDEVFACDACISGCGGIMQTSYFHEQFPPGVTKLRLHINALELLTIVVALKVFGKFLKGKKVLIFSDNMSSCNLINKGTARDEFHQACLREICYLAAVNEFCLKTQHTKGQDNRAADILSRWHLNSNSVELFAKEMSGQCCHRIQVPEALFSLTGPW